MTKRVVMSAQEDNPAIFDNSPRGAILTITDTKLYVSAVTLLIQIKINYSSK